MSINLVIQTLHEVQGLTWQNVLVAILVPVLGLLSLLPGEQMFALLLL
jgi:hypothetical protein